MDIKVKQEFDKLWKDFFNNAELPIIAYYTDETTIPENRFQSDSCLIANLNKVRNGTSLRFSVDSIRCPGGKRYTGFETSISKDFEYFLSCGIPGKLEGERYKKSPELVRKMLQEFPQFQAPKKYIIFKRWDKMNEMDTPEIVIFFAKPDVLSGLYTLANYDLVEEGVTVPFGSGCSSIIMYPYLEGRKQNPKCIIGMFDPSARPYINTDVLTFATHMNRFTQMMQNMSESFLTTSTWKTIKNRLDIDN